MSKYKVESLIIGSGDMTANTTSSQFYADTVAPAGGLGKDGDVYMRVAGASSDLFFKTNGVWQSLIGLPLTAIIAPSQTNFVWLSLPLASFRAIWIEYTITRGTRSQQGRLDLLGSTTPGITGSRAMNYAVHELDGSVGAIFDAQTNGAGSHMEALITTDSQAAPVNIKYTIKGWS